MPLTEALGHAERRDISTLAILSENDYRDGLGRLRAVHAASSEEDISSELALLTCTATRAR